LTIAVVIELHCAVFAHHRAGWRQLERRVGVLLDDGLPKLVLRSISVWLGVGMMLLLSGFMSLRAAFAVAIGLQLNSGRGVRPKGTHARVSEYKGFFRWLLRPP
jgi:hypothetical protein